MDQVLEHQTPTGLWFPQMCVTRSILCAYTNFLRRQAAVTGLSQDDQDMNQAIEASLNEGLSMEEPVKKPLEERVRRGETCVLLPVRKLTAIAHEETQTLLVPSLFGYLIPAKLMLQWCYMPSTLCHKFGKLYATIFQCQRQLKWVKYFWERIMSLSLQLAGQVRPCLCCGWTSSHTDAITRPKSLGTPGNICLPGIFKTVRAPCRCAH